MFRHSVSIRFDRLADAGRNRPLLVMIETADAAEHEDIMFTEINPTPGPETGDCPDLPPITAA